MIARSPGAAVSLAVLLGACVVEPPTGTQASAIVGGQPTQSWPEVGAIFWDDTFLCSGVLVGPRELLTAGHCVYGFEADPAPLRVVFAPDASTQAIATAVAALIVHPDYAVSPSNDVGVVQLVTDAPVAPVPYSDLPLGDQDLGATLTLVGYGDPAAGDDQGPRLRRTVDVTLGELTGTHLRWTGATGTCHGDSGGGAYMDLGGGPVLVGLHSEGDPNCAAWGSAARTDVFAGFFDDPEATVGDDDDATGLFGDDDDSAIASTGCACDASGSATVGWGAIAAWGLALLRRRHSPASSS